MEIFAIPDKENASFSSITLFFHSAKQFKVPPHTDMRVVLCIILSGKI